jgi:hypothetical protein
VDTNEQSEIGFAFLRSARLCASAAPEKRQEAVALPPPKARTGKVCQPSADPDPADQLGDHRTTIRAAPQIRHRRSLRLGNADAILRRFIKSNRQHPTYKALRELGKALKTVSLCKYLQLVSLRREIEGRLERGRTLE